MSAPLWRDRRYWCSKCEWPAPWSWRHRVVAVVLLPITFGKAWLTARGHRGRFGIACLYWRCWHWSAYDCTCGTKKHWKAVPHA